MQSQFSREILSLQQADHLCLFCDRDPAEQMPALMHFIQEGLSRDEQFVYLADEEAARELRSGLEGSGIDISDEIRRDRLKFLTQRKWDESEVCSKSPAFQLREMAREACAAGFKGVRFAVDMAWSLGSNITAGQLQQWKENLDRIVTSDFAGRIVCLYNRSRLSSEALAAALHLHPLALVGEAVCANPFHHSAVVSGSGNGHSIPSVTGFNNGHNGHSAAARVHQTLCQLDRERAMEREREALIRDGADEAERSRMEEELRRRANELALFFETAAIGLHWVGPDGTVLWANSAEMEMLGYSREEYIGHHIGEFHADAGAVEEILTSLGRGEKLRDFEARLRCKDGSIKTVLIDSSVLWDNDRIIHTQCFTRDITEKKRVEQELRAKEKELQLITDTTPVMFARCSRDGYYRFVNRAYAERFGLKPEDITGKQIGEFLGEEAHKTLEPYIRIALGGWPVEFDVEVPYRKLGLRYMHVAYIPEKDQAGHVTGWIASIQDITDKKNAEDRLRTSEERIRQLISLMPAAVYTCDSEGRLTFYNRRAAELWGREPKLGSRDERFCGGARLYRPDGSPLGHEETPTAAAVASGVSTLNQEIVIERPDGTRVTVAMNVDSIHDVNGKPCGAISVFQDITERKAAETALREVEARFEAILENSATVIYIKDVDGRYILINRRFEKLFYVTRHEVIGKTDFDLYPESLAKRFRENDLKVIATGKPLEIEEVAPHDDGLHTYISIKFPLQKENGSVYAVAGISTDITERKRAEEASRRLAAIVESSNDAIISKDLNGIITSWNNAAERIFGYTAEEAIGRPVLMLIPPERYEEEPNILNKIRRGERVQSFETVRRRKDGSLLEISLTISPIKDAAGKVIGASKIARDITERKRTERVQQALYELIATINCTESLSQIYDAAIEAICRCHKAHRASILLFDDDKVMRFKAWRGLSDGYRRAVEGHSPWQPGEQNPKPVCIDDIAHVPLEAHLREVIEQEGIRALAFIPITCDKRLLGKFMIYYNHPHQFTPEEIRPAESIATQVAFAIERRRSGEALERLVNERTVSLREAIAQMEEFSYSVSHDLRSPVRAMQGYASALLEDYGEKLDAHGRDYLERIVRSGGRMDRLIQDILVYSRISRREMHLQPLSLEKLIREIIDQYPEMQPPRAEIVVQEGLATVLGHEPSLLQAISNLLHNAVKFVPPGRTPHVRVWSERRGNFVRLSIQDNGIGIRPEYQPRLFGLFERVHPEKKYEGTGIGLAIVRKAVERMGGKAGVESDGVNGSTFWIELAAPMQNNGL